MLGGKREKGKGGVVLYFLVFLLIDNFFAGAVHLEGGVHYPPVIVIIIIIFLLTFLWCLPVLIVVYL